MVGRENVVTGLSDVFADHEVARYVTKVRSVTPLGADAVLLHAVAGMVPPGASEIMPENVVACRAGGDWLVALFQTTSAQFDGRAELSQALTAELSHEVAR